MTKILVAFLSFGIFFLNTSCTSENDVAPNETLTEESLLNVSYGSNSQQKYDIYLPAGRSSEKTKVIVLVHGGGWTEGDKADMEYLIPALKANHPDYAIVNINYVLADLP